MYQSDDKKNILVVSMMYPTATAGKKNSEKRGFSSFGGIKLARLNFFFIGGESVYNQLFYAKKKTFKVFVILNEVFESILG